MIELLCWFMIKIENISWYVLLEMQNFNLLLIKKIDEMHKNRLFPPRSSYDIRVCFDIE